MEVIMKVVCPVLVLMFVGTGFVYAYSQAVFVRTCRRSFALS